MPTLRTEVTHSLPVADAVLRLRGLASRLRARHAGRIDDVDEWWGRDRGELRLTLSGVRVKADVDVQADRVCVRAEVPLLALAFRGAIEDAVRSEIRTCLGGGAS